MRYNDERVELVIDPDFDDCYEGVIAGLAAGQLWIVPDELIGEWIADRRPQRPQPRPADATFDHDQWVM